MTGEKNRFTTHEKMWKLDDKQLTTPKHDELVLQLLSQSNSEKFLSQLGMGSYDISGRFVEEKENIIGQMAWKYINLQENDTILCDIREKALSKLRYNQEMFDDSLETSMELVNKELKVFKDEYRADILNTLEKVPKKVIPYDIRSEVPITSGMNKFIIGYIDIQLKIPQYFNSVVNPKQFTYNFEILVGNKVSMDDEGFMPTGIEIKGSTKLAMIISGHIPSLISKDKALAENQYAERCINIEIKPKIESFGETLRQVNTYREYLPSDIFAIYSPDSQFKEAFATQGIPLITPEDTGMK